MEKSCVVGQSQKIKVTVPDDIPEVRDGDPEQTSLDVLGIQRQFAGRYQLSMDIPTMTGVFEYYTDIHSMTQSGRKLMNIYNCTLRQTLLMYTEKDYKNDAANK